MTALLKQMSITSMRSVVGLVVSFALIAGLVVVATRAEGLESSRAQINDGGAWLVKRDRGVVGHVNHAVREVSARVKTSAPGAEFDVDQAARVVAVVDASIDQLILVDSRTGVAGQPTALPPNATVRAADDGVVVWTTDPLVVWRYGVLELSQLDGQSVLGGVPIFQSSGTGLASVSADNLVVYDRSSASINWLGDFTVDRTIQGVDLGQSSVGITQIGDEVVLVTDEQIGVSKGSEIVWLSIDGPVPIVLQQPGESSLTVSGATDDGRLVEIDVSTGVSEVVGDTASRGPLRPISFRGCVFGTFSDPPTFIRSCEGPEERSIRVEKLSGFGSEIRLRLVNEWVWVNDLDNGLARVAGLDGDIGSIDDWGTSPEDEEETQDEDNGSAEGALEQRENPDAEDAELGNDDEIDEDDINQPPVAEDDEALTRAERPVVVDVLRNDQDPDGDVLRVSKVELLTAGAGRVTPTADASAVQLSPEPGFQGLFQATYEISDGRGGTDTATISVEVREVDGSTNRPPVAVTDVAAARPGTPTSIDLLENDTDPDGDTLVLVDVVGEGGDSKFSSDGQLTFTPDSSGTDNEVELVYTISDDFGATDEGKVLIKVRPLDTNNEPDARNDFGSGSVGGRTIFNVLANDSDPDGDPLIVAVQPAVVSAPVGADTTVTITPDGELFFAPKVAGTFVWTYGASDGQETDIAQIRIDVTQSDVNRPPIAVRDEAVIPLGGTRLVHVLANDADPDGDVIAIVGQEVAPESGLDIELVPDVGFRVTVRGDAPPRPQFFYEISDGKSDPVSAAVVVAVADVVAVDQPPVLKPDAIEVRAGGTTLADLLVNDFDPEGGTLAIVGVSDTADGTLQISQDGLSVQVSVPATARQPFTFSYDAKDEGGNQSSTTVRVRVVPIDAENRPPIARPDRISTRADAFAAIAVKLNDSDPDGDPIRVESISRQPDHGVAELSDDFEIVIYTPSGDFAGTDRFEYVLVDALGARQVGEVLVGVMPVPPVNQPPVAEDDSDIAVDGGGQSIRIPVLSNDFDPDGDPLTVIDVGEPRAGTVAIVSDGKAVSYTPPAADPDGATETTFFYTITDGAGHTDTALVTITIIQPEAEIPPTTPPPAPTTLPPATTVPPEPEAPVAVNDSVGPVAEGDVVSVDVLANDFDPDGEVADLVVSPGSGVELVSGGVVRIVAPADTAEFTYTITDRDGLSDSATITVTVLVPEPEAPVAVNDSVGPVAEGDVVSVDVLANDFDPDGEVADLVVSPGTGVELVSGGMVRIVAPAETTDFSYTITDVDGLTATANISVSVIENRAPETTSIEASTLYETPVTIELGPGAIDPDGDDLEFVCCQSQQNGGTNVQSAGVGGASVDFRPDDGFSGDASFAYTVDDKHGHQVSGVVKIAVAPKDNEPPTADSPSLTLEAGKTLPVDLTNYASDPDAGDTISISAGPSQRGKVDVSGTGSNVVLSVPLNAGDGDDDSFAFTVTDLDGESAQGTVSIDVIPTQIPPPSAVADSASTLQGQAVDIRVLDNDSGESIRITQVGVSPNGSTQLSGDQVRFTPAAGFGGAATSFNYEITDAADRIATGTVTIDVTGVPAKPSPPVAQDQGSRTCSVTWSTPAANGGTISGYTLEDDQGGSLSLGVTNAQVFTTLTNGVTYKFRVVATNEAGVGEASEWSNACTPDVVPGIPAAPALTFGNAEIQVDWSAPANEGSTITGYELQIGGGTSASQATGATSLLWTGLSNGTAYQFRARAENAAGFGEWSSWGGPETPCAEPDAPGVPVATRGDASLAVTWSAGATNGCAIDNYEMRQTPGGVSSTVATSLNVSGLQNGREYIFEVRAENRSGWGSWSAASAPEKPCTVPNAPAAPSATRGDTLASVVWVVPGDNGCSLIGYELRTSAGVVAATGTSSDFSGLTNGTSYSFDVRAENEEGWGAWSGASSAVVPAGKPICSGGVSATGGVRLVDASWGTCAANGGLNFRYEAIISGGSWVSQGTATSKPYTGLTNGATYTITVRAANDVGTTAHGSAAATTIGLPSQVTGLSCAAGNGTGNCSWSTANGNGGAITKYEVTRTPGTTTNNGTGRSVSWSGLSNGTTYTVRVRACNAAGCGAWSGNATFRPVNPPLSVSLWENPFKCNGGVRQFGTISGAAPGETIGFASNPSETLLPGTANGAGSVTIQWQCVAGDVGTTWTVTATGQSSGRTVTFTVTGGAP